MYQDFKECKWIIECHTEQRSQQFEIYYGKQHITLAVIYDKLVVKCQKKYKNNTQNRNNKHQGQTRTNQQGNISFGGGYKFWHTTNP